MEEKLAYDSKYRELKAWEEKLKGDFICKIFVLTVFVHNGITF